MADFINNFYNSMMNDIKNTQQEVPVQVSTNPMFNNTVMFKTISDIPSMSETLQSYQLPFHQLIYRIVFL